MDAEPLRFLIYFVEILVSVDFLYNKKSRGGYEDEDGFQLYMCEPEGDAEEVSTSYVAGAVGGITGTLRGSLL